MVRLLMVPLVIVTAAGCSDSAASRAVTIATDSLSSHVQTARRSLVQLNDSLRASFTGQVRAEADSLSREVLRRRNEVVQLEEARERAINGLPGVVTLDSLNSYYASRWSEASFAETFETRSGSISFSKPNFTFAYLRSPRDIAFIRVGRERDSYSSREVIQAWLRESTEAKQRQGYQRVYLRSGPAEYGEYTEGLYRKGDAYMKTFFRYSRVQGTYDRFSLQYDFFVEIGSTARADRYRAEQYSSRIGS